MNQWNLVLKAHPSLLLKEKTVRHHIYKAAGWILTPFYCLLLGYELLKPSIYTILHRTDNQSGLGERKSKYSILSNRTHCKENMLVVLDTLD